MLRLIIKKQYLLCLCILFIVVVIFSEIFPKQITGTAVNYFGADSIYVGADLVVTDSTQDIIVTWKKGNSHPRNLCELYFVHPQKKDSLQFLFHSRSSDIADESKIVNLGKYAVGTELYFMYTVVDTVLDSSSQVKQILYTGQNRVGVDQYISSDIEPFYRGKWAAVARNSYDSVTVGFNENGPFGFNSIVFNLKGVSIDKNKIPPFQIVPDDSSFEHEMSVSFDINPEALMVILTNGGSYNDTTRVLEKDGVSLHYYYTVDGSDPVTSSTRIDYSGLFTISSTTTVNVYAAIEGDTTWYPSNVVTKTFTKSGSTGVNADNLSRGGQYYHFDNRRSTTSKTFDLFGRRITNSKLQHGLHLYTLNGNVYKKVIVE